MFANRSARWSLATGALCLVVLITAWFLLIGPRRSEAVELQGKTEAAEQQVGTLQSQVAELKADLGDLPKRRAQLLAVRKQLPAVADVPRLVRDLEQQAGLAGAELESVIPGTPALIDTTSGAGATAAAAATPAPGADTAGQVVSIPIAVKVSGDYVSSSLFVKYLQTKVDRAFLITAVALNQELDTAGTGDSVASSTTAPAAPSATATASSSASATPTPAATIAPSSTASPSVELSITGQIFVILDGSTSLADVIEDASKAGKRVAGASATPAATATSAPAARSTRTAGTSSAAGTVTQ
jgi:Tfp pilus assembly protein PilO